MRKAKTFVFASDLHGDLQDDGSVKALFQFLDDFQPDVRIFGGDLWDFACLRNGAKDTEDEKGRSLDEDFVKGETFITKFFESGKRKIFLSGNHDYKRAGSLLKLQDARMRDYGERLIEDMDAVVRAKDREYYPYNKRHGVAQEGNLRFVHGYACGVYATRKHVQTYGNVIHGHTHHVAQFHEPNFDGNKGWGAGCLCQLDHDYNSTHLAALRQSHGWAYGIILPNGNPIVNIATETETKGKFYVTEKFKLVG